MYIVNLTPHPLVVKLPGTFIATCGAYHWCRLGTSVPEDFECTVPECIQYIPEETVVVPASGRVARLKTSEVEAGRITIGHRWNDVVPMFQTQFGDVTVIDGDGNVTDFPEPEEDVVYVVSALVADRLRRPDVVSPHTVRDDSGKIVGCDGFVRHA